MKKYIKYILILLVFILLFLIAVFNLFSNNKKTYTTKELKSIEIREYEGQNLSSINSFRENSIKGPQYIDKNEYSLKIFNSKNQEKIYKYNEIINNYQVYKKVVTLNCVEGWSATILWEGILVKDLIDKKLITEDANTIIFRAHDGYSTSFPLSYIMDNEIIIAHKMNNVELPPENGFPFQLVAEDKYGYKWIKWITEIEISNDSSYEGYWEKRGYSNSGNLNEEFLK